VEAAAVTESKGQPFSVRFTKRTDAFMEAEAKRLKRSKSSLVEELAEEGTKVRRFPGMAFRGEGPYREPWIVGTGLDVWELCEILEHYDGSIERVTKDYDGVDERACRLALAYRREYPEEIGDAIAENNRTPEEWLALYPFVEYVGGGRS
jgi:uncharacterized protein (DUF433 family)